MRWWNSDVQNKLPQIFIVYLLRFCHLKKNNPIVGVIKRQGLKRSIVNYIGVGIGAISTLFIYPLDTETYGFIQFLLGTAMFLVPFAVLGVTTLTVRFFPDFKNFENGHNGFLGFLLAGIIISFCIFICVFYLFQSSFYRWLGALGFKVLSFSDNMFVILILCFLIALTNTFVSYTSNFKRVVVPAVFSTLFIKIATPTIILFLFYQIMPFSFVKPLLVALYILILLCLIYYLYSLKQLKCKINTSFLKRPLLAKMGGYAIYGIMGSVGGVVAFRIDSIMLSTLIDFKSNGVYTIALFMANAIAIPFVSITTIASPIIASSWKENDISAIDSIYKKSSLTLLIAGTFMFMLIWSSLDDVLRCSSNYDELVLGKYVVFFLGIGKVIDMTTGLNNQIIGMSKYFRFNLLAVLLLAGVNLFANYTLIPKFQLVGAAIATAFSLVVFNLAKFIFIWIKFKMQPLTIASVKVLVLAIVVHGLVSLMPSTSYFLLNILLRSVLICILFGLPVLYFNLSPDITNLVCEGRDKAMKWLRKK